MNKVTLEHYSVLRRGPRGDHPLFRVEGLLIFCLDILSCRGFTRIEQLMSPANTVGRPIGARMVFVQTIVALCCLQSDQAGRRPPASITEAVPGRPQNVDISCQPRVLMKRSFLCIFLLQHFLFLLLDLSIDFGTLTRFVAMGLGLGRSDKSVLACKA